MSMYYCQGALDGRAEAKAPLDGRADGDGDRSVALVNIFVRMSVHMSVNRGQVCWARHSCVASSPRLD